MKRTALLMVVAIAAALAGPIGAQEKELIIVSEKEGGWEVEELLRTVAEYTEIRIVYDPNSPTVARRKITFTGRAPIEKDEIFDWVRSVLFTQRLVLTEVGLKSRTWMLNDINSPNVVTRPIYVEADALDAWEGQDGVYIVTTIRLEHLRDTARARNALAQLATRQVGRVTDCPTTQSIVIGDFAPMVCAMRKLLVKLDADAAATDPTVRAAADPRIKQYESMLAKCQTAEAATYFIKRIEGLYSQK